MARIEIGRSGDLPERSARRFRIRWLGKQMEAFAIRANGRVRAFLNVCTHRELELDLGDGTFFTPDGALLRCRAHGALFHPETGACAGGICPKRSSLTEVPISEEEGILWAEEKEAPAGPL
ncbi:MAG TPA: Rieske 2Fe-2S domain-containing protein [Vulgatibacter sp.]